MVGCANLCETWATGGEWESRMRLTFTLISALAAPLLALAIAPATADDGLWLPDAFPSATVEKAYGFAPSQAWLDHVRLASVRLARGCSGSFVSPHGLVQTNHHCARDCVAELSTTTEDLVESGFYAKAIEDERKCPDVEIDQLIAITDVTARIAAATHNGNADAEQATEAEITRECEGGDAAIRCDVVALYSGAIFKLYRYRRYLDVRLVFSPELAIATFGGDLDNYEFPRYVLDVTYLRVYVDGRPLDTSANFLRYAARDVGPGELTFTAGNPAQTSRLDTVAQLAFERDVTLPRNLFYYSELRGLLTAFAANGAEQERISEPLLLDVEDSVKDGKGRFYALADPAIITARSVAERTLRAKVAADPRLSAQYGQAWDNIQATLDRFRPVRDRYVFTEGGLGFRSYLFRFAKALVRHADEAAKPDAQRLREFTDAGFTAQRQALESPASIFPDLEKLTLGFSLARLREALGADDPFVRKVLGTSEPAAVAADLIDKTKLADVALRRRLIDADGATIAASDDPLIAFARKIEPDLRAERRAYDDGVVGPLDRNSALIAKAMFALDGASSYPDATFTLRFSYGTVKGYHENGRDIPSITTIGGAFARATGNEPFKLPESWIAARAALDQEQPFNFVTTNDIIEGNSGSPVVNKETDLVGLIFDGNYASLGGTFGFDPETNRAIAVAVGALRMSLARIYRADRLVEELGR
jgi:Peptidase S46